MSAGAGECIGCGGVREGLLDFGPQPPSNRFLHEGESEVDRHPLLLGVCLSCGLLQLLSPMPVEMVRSRFDWLSYNEPEGHLDALVDHLRGLPGVGPASVIAGLTYKDDSTLARFNRLGYPNTFRLEMSSDLGLADATCGLESVQRVVRRERTLQAAKRHGTADVLLVRHVLEHAHDPRAFLKGLWPLVKPGGYVVFEMPDSRKFLDACDYSFLWEEHICYFTPDTLRAFLQGNGASADEIFTYPYALEDSLIGIVVKASDVPAQDTRYVGKEISRARRYSGSLIETSAAYRKHLVELRPNGKRAALFGAGHLAVKYLNLLDMAEFFDCVIDDNPHKQTLRMPGSKLPVRGSRLLENGEVDLCLLSLSPESEKKVLSARQSFQDNGGKFRSIFKLSSIALGGGE